MEDRRGASPTVRPGIGAHLPVAPRGQWVREEPTNQVSDSHVPRHRRWSSRQLHRLTGIASHAWAGLLVLTVSLGWVGYGVAAGFPSYWPVILQSIASIVTVVMLFAIQHLQARDQTVIHRKLDELLRATPHADNRIIAVEEAPDGDIEALTELNRQDRTAY